MPQEMEKIHISIETNPITIIIVLVLILTLILGALAGKLLTEPQEKVIIREQLKIEHHYHNTSTNTYIIGEKEMTCVGNPDSEKMLCYKEANK